MPLYEYECDACGHRFEVIQKYADPPIEVCTKCSGRVTKLLSSPAIQFKGSGWYITDYARAGKSDTGAGKGSESKSSSSDSKSDKSDKSDSKSESKSDSKPDTKSEAKSSAPTS